MYFLLLAGAAALFSADAPIPHHGAFSVSQMECVIGDNAESGVHRGGYNGVFSLSAPGGAGTAFVPAYAGLNLEHYFDARPVPDNASVFFEPRRAPIAFKRTDTLTAELYQPATPVYGVESWTRFTLSEPCCLDMAFRCIPRKNDLAGNMLGVFWASYINAPEDKSIHFLSEGSTLDRPVWCQYCTLRHNRDSTVCHENDNFEIPFAGNTETLFANIAPVRYSEPFYYGRVNGQALIYIFRPGPCIRFSHSPSGGGSTADGTGQHPAWDFQFIIPDYEVGKEYSMEMRLVYKPWTGREDVLNEVRRYLKR